MLPSAHLPPFAQFSAIADPTRGRIVSLLHERARPVHELASAFAISRPAISRHLRVLKEAGLVVEARQGRENVYRLEVEPLDIMSAWLAEHRRMRKGKRAPKAETPAVAAKPIVVAPIAPKPIPEPVPVAETPRPPRRKPAPRASQLDQPSLFSQMELEL